MNYIKNIKLYVGFFLMSISLNLFAQDINKQVQVTKAFDPIVRDAYKINRLPKIIDTLKISPYFNYSIAKRPISTQFEVKKIEAAKMAKEPLSRLRRGFVRAGYGNNLSPLAEISFSDLRSEKRSWGIYAGHYSSFGDIQLADESMVDNDYGSTEANAFLTYFFKNAYLKADAFYQHQFNTYYGYDTNVDVSNLTYDKTQTLNDAGAKIRYASMYVDSSNTNYDISVSYKMLADAFKHTEHQAKINAGINRYWGKELFGLEMGTQLYERSSFADSSTNLQFSLRPNLTSYGKKWRVNVGIELFVDGFNKQFEPLIYPQVSIQYDIVNQYFIPYVELDGFMETNHFEKILSENPFIKPGETFYNTNHKLKLGGGLKGNFSKGFYYNFSYNYSLIDDMYFYVNDFDSPELSKFELIYDNVRLAEAYGQISFHPTKFLHFELNGKYLKYSLTNLQYAYHKPDYEANFIAAFDFKKKLYVELNFFTKGKRYALPSENADPIQLDEVYNANLALEYRFTKFFTTFVQVNNLSSTKNDLWYLYPMQKFNFRLGLTYAF